MSRRTAVVATSVIVLTSLLEPTGAAVASESRSEALTAAPVGEVAHWSFDDQLDPTSDGVDTHEADVVGAAFESNDVAPVQGNLAALRFDGDDYAEVPDPGGAGNLDGFPGLTISAWVKPSRVDITNGGQMIVSKYNTHIWPATISYWFLLRGDEIELYVGETPSGREAQRVSVGVDLVPGQWIHVAGTWNGGREFHLFVNGVEVNGTSSWANDIRAMADSTVPVNIGSAEAFAGGERSAFFHGLIDEVRLFRQALTPAEVAFLPMNDVIAPTIDLRSPLDGDTFTRNATVTAAFSCNDEAGGSGLATCSGTTPDGQQINTSTIGDHQFTARTSDLAGNTASLTHTYRVLDVTDPVVNLRSPPNGATYHRDESVLADFDCVEEPGGSGIDTCVGTVPDGSTIDTSQSGDHEFTVTATDRDENTQTTTHTYTVVPAPTIDLVSPPDGAVYGQHQVVNAIYSCTVQEPGDPAIESCVGTVPSGEAVDTSSIGHHDFTVNVIDTAGNDASRTNGYAVDARRPDAMIRMAGRPNFVGDDVYNASGLDQKVQVPVEYLGTERMDVKVQNEGPVDERMTLRGSAGTGRFEVRYFHGSFDITQAVLDGTYRTARLQPGSAERVTVVVTAGRLADRGDRLRVTLTAVSRVDPTRRDTVAARVTSTGLTLFTACYVIAPNCYNEVPVATVGGYPITFLARIAPAHAGTAEVWRRAPGSTTWAWVGAPTISSTGRIQWTWHTTPADIREADYSIQFRIPGQSQRSNILGVAVINPVD